MSLLDIDEIQKGNIIVVSRGQDRYLGYVSNIKKTDTDTQFTILPMAPSTETIKGLKANSIEVTEPKVLETSGLKTPHKVYMFGVTAKNTDFMGGKVTRVGYFGGQTGETKTEIDRAAMNARTENYKLFRTPLPVLSKMSFPTTSLGTTSISRAFGNRPPPAFITGETPQPDLSQTHRVSGRDRDGYSAEKPPIKHEKRDDPFGGLNGEGLPDDDGFEEPFEYGNGEPQP